MYLNSLSSNTPNNFIFKSRKGDFNHLTRQHISQIIKSSCAAVGIKEMDNYNLNHNKFIVQLLNNLLFKIVLKHQYNI